MNLPKTDFAMRANLPENEPKRLAKWEEERIYERVLEKNKDGKPFILHDGPPYANGPIHIGHAFNKILKDFVNKSHAQRGFFTPYVPGWDCHGQPIEHMVEKTLGPEKMAKIDQPTLRRLCREWAEKYVDVQREGFKRLGVNGDWEHPYLTFTPNYEAGNVEVFKKMYLDGSVYRGRKPIHWCKRCHTALAEAEIEYSDETSPSIFVKFKMDLMPGMFEAAGAEGDAYVLIWTTTPWTLPANTAVSLAPDADYVMVVADGSNLIMARELVEQVAEIAGWESYDLVRAQGPRVHGPHLHVPHPPGPQGHRHLRRPRHARVGHGRGAHGPRPRPGRLPGGAGVRRAAAHAGGRQRRAHRRGGPLRGPRRGRGEPGHHRVAARARHARGPEGDPAQLRCHEPVIFRATDQWFVSMDKNSLREDALDAIDHKVEFIPAWAKNRIGSMVADRPDWCISRQRSWGVPIPVFKCAKCGNTVATAETFDAVIDLFYREGADAWFTHEPSEYLPRGVKCETCGCSELIPEKDILDVWWESGVSHTSVLKHRADEGLRFPADMYLEGSDQHRGWFQSSLLTSMGAYGVPPYKSVMHCGFTMDAEGKKMSKSAGNGVDPADVMAKSGADVLRLWVASVDYSQDVNIGDEILERTSEAYRRIRNTMRFLLGSLSDFDDLKHTVTDWNALEPVDQWAMVRLWHLLVDVERAYDEYKFHMVYRAVYDYIVGDLSAVYMDATKDRVYSEAPDSPRRRAAQTVLMNIVEVLVRVLAPVLSFTTDEVWEHYPEAIRSREGRPGNVQLAGWPEKSDFAPALPGDADAERIAEDFGVILGVREIVTKALEDARGQKIVNKSQEADVTVTAPRSVLDHVEQYDAAVFEELFIVASVSFVEGEELSAEVRKTTAEKCPRCWNYRELGGNPNHPSVCERCGDVLDAIGYEEAGSDA